VIDFRLVPMDNICVRVCASDGTTLAIGSFSVPFCPECAPNGRVLFCSRCDKPLYISGEGHPYCGECHFAPSAQDTYFKGECGAAR